MSAQKLLMSALMARFVPFLFVALAFASGASAQTVRDIARRGACSTAGVERISAQLAEAQRCINPTAFVRFAPHPRITLSSARVHPYAQANAAQAIQRAAERTSITINSAFRSVADQYVLHNSGGCGLAAPPGRSNHQSGRAIDVQNWSGARSPLQAEGCVWFGSRDRVHFDCPGVDRRSDSVLAFQRLWNLNNPGDRISEDGNYGPQTDARLARTPAGGFSRGLCDGTDPGPGPAPDPGPGPDPAPSGGRIRGVVYTGDLDARVSGATVRVVEAGTTMSVDADGAFLFEIGEGTYTLEANAEGYSTGRRACTVSGGDAWCSIEVVASGGPDPVSTDGVATGQIFEERGSERGPPIPGARVVVEETGLSVHADGGGTYSLSMAAGEYTLVASAEGYASVRARCAVIAGAMSSCSIGLPTESTASTLLGVVIADGVSDQRVVGARVRILESGLETTSRSGDGLFRFTVSEGEYSVEASGPGFETRVRVCRVSGEETWCSISLARRMSSDSSEEELRVETPEVDDARIPPEEDLASTRIAQGCSASGGAASAWLGLLFLVRRRRRRR